MMPSKLATPQEISNYLDDMKAGMDAGPLGTPAFREAVYRRAGLPLPEGGAAC